MRTGLSEIWPNQETLFQYNSLTFSLGVPHTACAINGQYNFKPPHTCFQVHNSDDIRCRSKDDFRLLCSIYLLDNVIFILSNYSYCVALVFICAFNGSIVCNETVAIYSLLFCDLQDKNTQVSKGAIIRGGCEQAIRVSDT